MTPMPQANLRLQKGSLNASLAAIKSVSKRTSAYLANKAVLSIAIKAFDRMPVVAPGKIAADMAKVGHVRNAKDKDWRKTNNERRDLTTAERVVLASIHPGSRFNQLTGGVFKRMKPIYSSPSPGGGGRLTSARGYKLGAQNRLRFWAWVEEQAIRMTAARRSSSGFFQLGARVVRLIFSRGASPVRMPPSDGASSGVQAMTGGGKINKAIGRVAGGTRAVGDGNIAKASFWVATTEPDSKGKNTAVTRILEPVWQRAVNDEAKDAAAYAEKLMAQALREQGFTVR
jgi:hypothetical protein